MLRLTLEILPNGDESRRQVIGELDVWNVSDLAPMSDYAYRLQGGGTPERAGHVRSHPRKRGAWELIWRVLCDATHHAE